MMMKKKSILMALAVGFLLCTVSNLQAQDHPSGTTNLNVTLKPVKNIIVNNTDVDMEFASSGDYANGVNKTMVNHLTVNSTGGFQVTVKSDGDVKNGTISSIPIADFNVTATNGTANPFPTTGGPTFATALDLSATGGQLMTSGDGIAIGSITVKYNAIGGADFVAPAVPNPPAGGTVYTAILTYTIADN